jgi:hypothetical protein
LNPPSSIGQTADIYAGRFANQRQVFTHLRSTAGMAFIPDRVEVIWGFTPHASSSLNMRKQSWTRMEQIA